MKRKMITQADAAASYMRLRQQAGTLGYATVGEALDALGEHKRSVQVR